MRNQRILMSKVSHKINSQKPRFCQFESLPPREALQRPNIYIFWTLMLLSLIPLTLIMSQVKVNRYVFYAYNHPWVSRNFHHSSILDRRAGGHSG